MLESSLQVSPVLFGTFLTGGDSLSPYCSCFPGSALAGYLHVPTHC